MPGELRIQSTKSRMDINRYIQNSDFSLEIRCILVSGLTTHMIWPKTLILLYFWRNMHIYHVWNALERRVTSNYAADDPDIKEKTSNQRCHIFARLVVCCLLCRCFSAALKPTLNKWCTAGFGKHAPETEWKVIQRKLRRSGGFSLRGWLSKRAMTGRFQQMGS